MLFEFPPMTLKPPLKWAGGKRWLVPYLAPVWAKHREQRMVEPFCGGLAIALGLMPTRALLNDINPHLVNFLTWLGRGLHIECRMENDAELFYAHRARFNELIRTGQASSKEAAELFYFLNRTGYNGLCRFNRRGEFNVPFGKYKTIHYVREFADYQPVFSAWDLQVGPFDAIALAPDDFVYADPPYDVEFVSYSKEGFGWEDQVRLGTWLAKHSGPVALSNQATPRIVRLYESLGFEITLLDAPRRISCTGDRSSAKEVLALKGA